MACCRFMRCAPAVSSAREPCCGEHEAHWALRVLLLNLMALQIDVQKVRPALEIPEIAQHGAKILGLGADLYALLVDIGLDAQQSHVRRFHALDAREQVIPGHAELGHYFARALDFQSGLLD